MKELLERELLSPALLEHVGLVGGLLWVQPKLAAERLLAGELPALESGVHQPTIARKMIAELAAWDKELTVQHIKHLICFLRTLAIHLSKATDAMYQVVLPLMKVISKIPPKDRAEAVVLASEMYLEVPEEGARSSGVYVARTASIP